MRALPFVWLYSYINVWCLSSHHFAAKPFVYTLGCFTQFTWNQWLNLLSKIWLLVNSVQHISNYFQTSMDSKSALIFSIVSEVDELLPIVWFFTKMKVTKLISRKLLEWKIQHSWAPSTIVFGSAAFVISNIIYFLTKQAILMRRQLY